MNKLFSDVAFWYAAERPEMLPPTSHGEVAFLGRSNAGKSTALNALCNKRLARVSNTPGRTQQALFFRFNDHRALIDLPGYGYAARRGTHWRALVDACINRESIRVFVLLIDARRGVMDADRQLLDYVAPLGKPLIVLMSKIDKLSASKRTPAIASINDALAGYQTVPYTAIAFSGRTREGVSETIRQIQHHLA